MRFNIHLLIGTSLLLCVHSYGKVVPNVEDWTELPRFIQPGSETLPPSDAFVLFDGTDLAQWLNGDRNDAEWLVKDGVLEIVHGRGNIYSKRSFGDVQLHIEWMIPETDFGNGNSGIYLQGRYEVQIYDSYRNDSKIYYNGQTGSFYKQYRPLVNASKPRGQWDAYDIIVTTPRFNKDGSLNSPAIFTVFHNGILIQHNSRLKGTTTHENTTAYEAHDLKQPLTVQDYGDRVLFRNIWIRVVIFG